MKKIVKNISQILTGAGAAICLWTGKAISVYAEEAPKTSVEEGASAARASGMPAVLTANAYADGLSVALLFRKHTFEQALSNCARPVGRLFCPACLRHGHRRILLCDFGKSAFPRSPVPTSDATIDCNHVDQSCGNDTTPDATVQ